MTQVKALNGKIYNQCEYMIKHRGSDVVTACNKLCVGNVCAKHNQQTINKNIQDQLMYVKRNRERVNARYIEWRKQKNQREKENLLKNIVKPNLV